MDINNTNNINNSIDNQIEKCQKDLIQLNEYIEQRKNQRKISFNEKEYLKTCYNKCHEISYKLTLTHVKTVETIYYWKIYYNENKKCYSIEEDILDLLKKKSVLKKYLNQLLEKH